MLEERNEKSEKSNRKIKVIVIIAIIAAIIIAILAVIISFTIKQEKDTRMKKGVSIAGIDVSELSKEEATEAIERFYQTNPNDYVYLRYKNYDYCVSIEQIGAKFDISTAVEKAYQFGREGNWLENDLRVLELEKNRDANVEIELSYNDVQLEKALNDISTKLPDQVEQSSYYIEGKTLVVTSGTVGVAVQVDVMKDIIIDAITSASYKNTYYTIVTYNQYPDPIDVDKIHSEIYQEVQDAYYTTNPRMVYAEVQGIDFKASIDEVKQMINSEKKEEYEIDLAVTDPKITTEDLGLEAFPHVLATYKTEYATSNKNRTTNLKLAASKINGTVIMPGEEFSYNKVVGKRTIAAGYKEAAIYSNGEVASGLGGGICQITSTLYNAILFADLEITQRQNHTFVPSYVVGGRDATVVYGSIDFKFKNNRDYPVKITATVKNGVAQVSIRGLRTDDDYEIKVSSKKVKNTTYGGKSYSIYKAYKYYYKDDKLIKTELLSTDTYKNH